MAKFSTEQVARLVGLNSATLSRYIKAGKIFAPPETMAGGMRIRLWSKSDIERLKEALPKIANGRKTRYKKHSALSNQQSAKKKQTAVSRQQSGKAKPKNKKKKP
jgi:predicted DNA-binding transcriptional regulator AlpA